MIRRSGLIKRKFTAERFGERSDAVGIGDLKRVFRIGDSFVEFTIFRVSSGKCVKQNRIVSIGLRGQIRCEFLAALLGSDFAIQFALEVDFESPASSIRTRLSM